MRSHDEKEEVKVINELFEMLQNTVAFSISCIE